jgi:hypothetical protein
MEFSESAEPVDPEAAADALVRDLGSDSIERWCDGVRAAIAASRATSELGKPQPRTGIEDRKRKIEEQIAALQSQLEELNDGPDTVEHR